MHYINPEPIQCLDVVPPQWWGLAVSARVHVGENFGFRTGEMCAPLITISRPPRSPAPPWSSDAGYVKH